MTEYRLYCVYFCKENVYVVAKDTASAINKIESYFNENDIGFKSQRKMTSIEVVAVDDRYHEPYESRLVV